MNWSKSGQPFTVPQFALSHCSPASIVPSPQLAPEPPWQPDVSNWQSPAQLSAPEVKESKSEQPLTVPQDVLSHCSPASIVPSPQFPPLADRQFEVSKSHAAVHRNVPLTKPSEEQPVTVPHAEPSHCSPASLRPSPQ